MPRRAIFALACASLITLSCCGGGQDGLRDLAQVPANSLCYMRVSSAAAPLITILLPEEESGLPAGLLEDLLAPGAVGVAVISLDFTSLKPQLLFLSRELSSQDVTEIAVNRLECRAERRESRTDLLTERGSVLGAVAQRQGWTSLYLGKAPTAVIGPWLEMDREGSLAADSGLLRLSGGTADISVFLPGNMIDFMGLLPLQRWYPKLANLRTHFMTLRPRALRLDLTLAPMLVVEARLLREGNSVTRLRVELEDASLSGDSLYAGVAALMQRLP